MEITSARFQIPVEPRKLLEKNHTSVVFVGRASCFIHLLLGTLKPTPDMNLMGFDMERSHINARNVGTPSVTSNPSKDMKGITLEKTPISVNSVEKPSCTTSPFKHTNSHTVEKSHTNVSIVGKL